MINNKICVGQQWVLFHRVNCLCILGKSADLTADPDDLCNAAGIEKTTTDVSWPCDQPARRSLGWNQLVLLTCLGQRKFLNSHYVKSQFSVAPKNVYCCLADERTGIILPVSVCLFVTPPPPLPTHSSMLAFLASVV